MKFDFYPAFDYYVLHFWEDDRGKHWNPVDAYDDLPRAMERARKERSYYPHICTYTTTVVWLRNATTFLPFIAHDGEKWGWINADGLSLEQLRAATITAIALTSAACGEHAEVGHNPHSRALNTADGRVFISPFRLKPLVFPDGVGEDLVKLTT